MAGTAGSKKPVYVTVSVLDAGHITLPDYLFVAGADPNVRTTVPSLSFLVQHPSPPASRHANVTNLVFDLGVKRDLSGYPIAQQPHVAARRPIITDPDCSASLRKGASSEGGGKELLNPETEIDFVILSHVHWDHIGTPSDFSSAIFVVGSGTLDLLRNGAGPYYPPDPSQGSSFQEYYTGQDTPVHTPTPAGTQAKLPSIADEWSWQPFGGFPRTIDFFGDQSVYVVDSPGHIYGHVNHDTRLLSGEKEIAEYDDGHGGIRSVHVHTGLAKKTLAEIDAGINQLRQETDVEVVLAHDKEWRERNRHRFWPGKL